MNNRKILEEIIKEEELNNISLNSSTFTIKFGDIENIRTETEFKYTLLDTYIEVPYTFNYSKIKLHRGIVNEFETEGVMRGWRYSGFVHYNGSEFCWGKSGVNLIAASIQMDGLDSDKFGMFLVKFKKFLSTSSHGTRGNFRTINLNVSTTKQVFIEDFIQINNIRKPSVIKEIIESVGVSEVDFSKPFEEILYEAENRSFKYNDNIIIPKVVRHPYIETRQTVENIIRLDLKNIDIYVKDNIKEIILDKQNENRCTKRITFQDCLHKFPNFPRRMDGGIYI